MAVNLLEPIASVVIVSFNTRDLLRECLTALAEESRGLNTEVLVVDNVSKDGSADMVAAEFPYVKLIRSDVNLGFAAANNRAFARAVGRYVVLLNSDAFLQCGALHRAIRHMEHEPEVGIGGAKLVGRDGSWQPSARLFPSLLNDFLTLSGLSALARASLGALTALGRIQLRHATWIGFPARSPSFAATPWKK